MLKTMYSVYDKKGQTYAAPFTEIKDGTAIRAMQDLMSSNPNHPFSRYPEDFELVRVGTFNELDASVSDEPQGLVIQFSAIGE